MSPLGEGRLDSDGELPFEIDPCGDCIGEMACSFICAWDRTGCSIDDGRGVRAETDRDEKVVSERDAEPAPGDSRGDIDNNVFIGGDGVACNADSRPSLLLSNRLVIDDICAAFKEVTGVVTTSIRVLPSLLSFKLVDSETCKVGINTAAVSPVDAVDDDDKDGPCCGSSA